MSNLTDIVLALPASERRSLMEKIKISLELDSPFFADAAHYCEYLFKVSAYVLGLPSIPDDRREESVFGRMMVIRQLLDEGMTMLRCGELLHRHYSTISHLRDKMDVILTHPNWYGKEITYWNTFKNIVNNETY